MIRLNTSLSVLCKKDGTRPAKKGFLHILFFLDSKSNAHCKHYFELLTLANLRFCKTGIKEDQYKSITPEFKSQALLHAAINRATQAQTPSLNLRASISQATRPICV
eukprot:CAMPEP_0169265052 /NCGR_PEP_ID=MMETSP1016-20121227/45503_1 /TAXON_ID=342587 /ORGANISM="Karlodinium micrum, Strain CCMP2283" /LENGTH=106 /DNA_ID=CAMNT_0009348555 /DNA_START=15 /DNA_END=332 /DNA_ORIENTATION=-